MRREGERSRYWYMMTTGSQLSLGTLGDSKHMSSIWSTEERHRSMYGLQVQSESSWLSPQQSCTGGYKMLAGWLCSSQGNIISAFPPSVSEAAPAGMMKTSQQRTGFQVNSSLVSLYILQPWCVVFQQLCLVHLFLVGKQKK